MVPTWVPLLAALSSIVVWGSFTVPLKSRAVVEADVHPLWFQLYMSLGVSLSSFAFLAVEPSAPSDFTMWGGVSAFMWTFSNVNAMAAIQFVGIAMAQSVWAAQIAIVSFAWRVAWHGDAPRNLPLTVGGLCLLVLGICTLAYVTGSASKHGAAAAKLSTVSSAGGDLEPLLVDDDLAKQKNGRWCLGLICATTTGLTGGSIFVPWQLAPARYRDGLQTVKFAFSQGVATFATCLVWVPVLFLVLYVKHAVSEGAGRRSMSQWLPAPHVRTCMFPGMLAGVLWNMGNLGATVANLPPLGAVGYTLTQAALLPACMWGVFYFKEIRGRRNIVMFSVGAVVILAGLIITGYFGQTEPNW
eukprot:CAMPEP_0174312586 /NCGR_PEP_ID=MMETSP0810-20121108/4379_1 /TAXON_ID=73025 ORGANISM="Eutreptiella gymnastica-like, Strain CCMP1594" /NCGR_SAMPLE_ID=MMETSP0810 /ASSEMBLY_ACC=CAM_ASM_000659 /LENGTH=356 /DNA_ID=CAMNT_0015421009 /DNA_START=131 /DNA_END=1201 /DNA_ORIENTATION=-